MGGAGGGAPSSRQRALGTASRLFAGRLVVMAAQILFMAVSARLLTPADFGAYAAALVALGLVAVVTSEGLATSIVVQTRLVRGELRGLATASLLLGAALGALVWIAAPAWSALWDTPDAVPLVRAMAIPAALSPYTSVLLGAARRYGRIRGFSVAVLTTGVLSVTVALCVILIWPSLLSLAIQPVLSAVLLVGSHRWWLGFVLTPSSRPSGLRRHARPASADTGFQLLDFVSVNIGAWSVGVSAGAATLGVWNRASTLSQAPMMMLRGSISEALFESHRSSASEVASHSRRTPDYALQVSVVVGSLAAVVLYFVTPVLLGPQWLESAGLAVPLALYMGLLVGSTRGTVALRVALRHGLLWSLWCLSLVPLAAGLTMTLMSASAWPVAWAYVAQGFVLVVLLEAVREERQAHRLLTVLWRALWIAAVGAAAVLIVLAAATADLAPAVRVGVTVLGAVTWILLVWRSGLLSLARGLVAGARTS